MHWRHLRLARAVAASGFLTFATLGAPRAGEPSEPVPGLDSGAETVKVLDAEKSGALAVDVRGHGQDRVRVALRNTTARRLRVVLPPGLVASNSVGQGGPFQSMGLGAAGNPIGGFGKFGAAQAQTGFRSIPATAESGPDAVTVPPGQKVDLDVPAVCLNYGLPTPTARDKFRLVDVDDYSKDVRVRKALRSLATLGTSQGTAQAAMWRVCNDVPFELMLSRGEKVVNPAEVALASRFLEALDQGSDLVDPAYLAEARVFVAIQGDAASAKDAKRLAAALDGLRILGLPARILAPGEAPKASSPALHLAVTLSPGLAGEVKGRVVVRSARGLGGDEPQWATIGQANFKDAATLSAFDGPALAGAIDHAVSLTFVSAKVAGRSPNSTTIRIENRLPFTLAHVTVKAGTSAGAPMLTLPAVGVGPGRSGLATIPAANGTIDRVELNGL